MTGLPTYPECKIRRQDPNLFLVSQDIAKAVGENYRVLPTFEKALYEYKHRKHYSLHTNEFLKCRLRSFVQHFEEREFAPFTFIDIRDFHFYNCMTRFKTSESFHTKKDFRYKLKVGPGVDFRGQMPIPQDLLMKRGSQKPRAEAKRHPKPQNEEQKDTKDENVEEKNN